MQSRKPKAVAHAGHALDAFVQLRAQYSMMSPLLYSCVLEIAKLAMDADRRTPSLQNLDAFLDDAALVCELRESFAVRGLVPPTGDSDVDETLQWSERVDEKKRRAEFETLVDGFRTKWASLRDSSTMTSCGTIRDKLLAHREVARADGGYTVLDVGTLGLKLGDVGKVIDEIEDLINRATLIFRATSYDFIGLQRQLGSASRAFWKLPTDGQ